MFFLAALNISDRGHQSKGEKERVFSVILEALIFDHLIKSFFKCLLTDSAEEKGVYSADVPFIKLIF